MSGDRNIATNASQTISRVRILSLGFSLAVRSHHLTFGPGRLRVRRRRIQAPRRQDHREAQHLRTGLRILRILRLPRAAHLPGRPVGPADLHRLAPEIPRAPVLPRCPAVPRSPLLPRTPPLPRPDLLPRPALLPRCPPVPRPPLLPRTDLQGPVLRAVPLLMWRHTA